MNDNVLEYVRESWNYNEKKKYCVLWLKIIMVFCGDVGQIIDRFNGFVINDIEN